MGGKEGEWAFDTAAANGMLDSGGLGSMKKAAVVILLAAVLAAAAAWWLGRRAKVEPDQLVIYGNVDMRQVNLAFNATDRISTLLVQEGVGVKPDQTLGTLEKERFEAAVAQAEARVEAQRQVVRRLENGTRPEEIDQARANAQAAQTDVDNTLRTFERLRETATAGATSRQSLDNARTAFETARSRLRVSQKALELALLGPREEDIAEARAVLRANEAALVLLRRDLANATLVSPTAGVVQNRLLEPGDMASPQRPVFSIAILDPKWVRAYVPGPDLGKIRHGMKASVSTDSFPGRRYEGWVGFISPSASFTPKSIETTELRTSLVYEVRIFVKDPSDELRLGMPATVLIHWDRNGAAPEVSGRGDQAGGPAS
jgi:HlyD family secretion protein